MITAADAIHALREVVKGKEGHVHEGLCEYVDDTGQPACVVGHAFEYLGVDLELFRASRSLNDCVVGEYLIQENVRMTDDALQVFARAQDSQDARDSWGTALAHAEETYGELKKEGE